MEKPVFVKDSDRRNKHGSKYGWFQCECKNLFETLLSSVKSGNTVSCGCLQIKHVIEMGKKRKTHGKSNTCEHRIWRGMKYRCYNSNCKAFKNYGGRGIKICDRWLNSFANFYEDMGARPSDLYEIERTDNNGDYSPENCIWQTQKPQARNKRNNRKLTMDGVTKVLSEWEEFTGIDRKVITNRIDKHGWSVERALTEPVRHWGKQSG